MNLEYELLIKGNYLGEEVIQTCEAPADPVALGLEKLKLAATLGKTAEWVWNTPIDSELRKAETPPSDGDVIEQIADERWTYSYKNGRLLRMKCENSDGDAMYFDADGEELHPDEIEDEYDQDEE